MKRRILLRSWVIVVLVMAQLAFARSSIVDLGTLGGSISSAKGINNRGQIVGTSQTAVGEFHAFLWYQQTMTDLGTLPGEEFSEAFDINERGQVVGVSRLLSAAPQAFLWEKGQMIALGTLGGAGSTAYAINNRGQVVG